MIQTNTHAYRYIDRQTRIIFGELLKVGGTSMQDVGGAGFAWCSRGGDWLSSSEMRIGGDWLSSSESYSSSFYTLKQDPLRPGPSKKRTVMMFFFEPEENTESKLY